MWNRSELKAKGKLAMKANYWKSVLAAAVLTAVTATQVTVSRSDDDELNAAIQTLRDTSASSGISFGTLVGLVVAVVGVGILIALLIDIFVNNPLTVGGHYFFLKNAHEPAEFKDIGEPFRKGHLGNIWVVMFMTDLFIGLWSLLLIIPGIVKSYEYQMVPFLLAEDPSLSWKEAQTLSKRMMDGQKMAAFKLDLSFLGWHLLAALTAGILGVFYVFPYKRATDAELYLTLRDRV